MGGGGGYFSSPVVIVLCVCVCVWGGGGGRVFLSPTVILQVIKNCRQDTLEETRLDRNHPLYIFTAQQCSKHCVADLALRVGPRHTLYKHDNLLHLQNV